MDDFSVSTRISINLDQYQGDSYTNYTFHVPLTLNIGYGSAASAKSMKKFGVLCGFVIARNSCLFFRELIGQTN
jgi:hypothetical protein